jgi:hypothetical protein
MKVLNDNEFPDTAIATNLALVAFFDLLRDEQPAFAMKLADKLVIASKKSNPVEAGAAEQLAFLATVLTKPPRQQSEH